MKVQMEERRWKRGVEKKKERMQMRDMMENRKEQGLKKQDWDTCNRKRRQGKEKGCAERGKGTRGRGKGRRGREVAKKTNVLLRKRTDWV